MFLRFAFKNHGSFRDAAEVSFLATRVKDEDVHVPMKSDLPHAKFGVLPVLALYGGNASGKTTVLTAFERMVSLILNSQSQLSVTDEIPFHPFKLNNQSLATPSHFECEFVAGNIRYLYGFTCSKKIFEEEWLYAWPNGNKQLWFHRKGNIREEWYFGPALKGDRKRTALLTKDNSLFLSTAAQFNHEQLSTIYKAFKTSTLFESPWSSHKPLTETESPLFEGDRQREIQRLLSAADLGVRDFRVKQLRAPGGNLTARHMVKPDGTDGSGSATSLRAILLEDLGNPKQLELLHEGADGFGCWFEPTEESDGTITLINRLHQFLNALNVGSLTVVDEIDRSLHPRLCAELIKLFTNPLSNPKGAQLLFSTHDVSLMEHLRRDEVLLAEKRLDGRSQLVPMVQYKLLRRDDMPTVYAEGRVGGTPQVGNLSILLSPARVAQ
jgi:AAA15 family ATPase/GTPase